jgi:glycosyltransferase involved in cell wall biosynthesis
VSVIIPVYNGERYLAEAIESVLSQTHRPLELLVVDDGSTDGTADVARSYPEARTIHQPNRGHGAAKNAGAAAARGEFLAFLDADDVWAPDKLRLQVAYLEANDDVGCVLCNMANFLELGQAEPPWLGPAGLSEVPAYIPSALLVRKTVFEEVGGFDPTYRHANDIDFHLRAVEAGAGVGRVDQLLLHRRIHNSNLSHDRAPGSPLSSEMFRALRASIVRKRGLGDEEAG